MNNEESDIFLIGAKFILDFIFSDISIGLFLGLASTWIFLHLQFKHSITYRRIKNIISATKEILEDNSKQRKRISYIRDRHRYSLSVQLDDIYSVYKTNKHDKINDRFPNLCDLNKDRWGYFDLYVRPVISDINSYQFLGWLNIMNFRSTRHLKLISEFLISIENVVGEIDACRELEISKNINILNPNGGPGITIDFELLKSISIDETNKLIQAYSELEKAYYNWINEINKN